MNDDLKPSVPGYDFSAADLRRARITPEAAGRIILAGAAPQAGGASAPDGTAALLAAIIKQQRPRNTEYRQFPFFYDIWRQQQILTENENRGYLLIQNVGSGDLMILFEVSTTEVVDFSALADQQTLVIKQTRAVRLVAGGSYEPQIPPINTITLFTLNTATNGIVVEG